MNYENISSYRSRPYCYSLCRNIYKLPINITRCSSKYESYHFPEKLIPLMIKNILECKKLPVYRKGDNVRIGYMLKTIVKE